MIAAVLIVVVPPASVVSAVMPVIGPFRLVAPPVFTVSALVPPTVPSAIAALPLLASVLAAATEIADVQVWLPTVVTSPFSVVVPAPLTSRSPTLVSGLAISAFAPAKVSVRPRLLAEPSIPPVKIPADPVSTVSRPSASWLL